MNELIQVPELADLLAFQLDHASLACCVRVSKLWHKTFIPHLWYSFGASFPFTIRFGVAIAPQVHEPEARGPLQVPLHQDPSKTTTALALVNRHIYPFQFPSDNPRGPTPSFWARFFDGYRIQPAEEAIIRTAVAKYGRHVRRLAIRSIQVFRVVEHYCTHLRALHCCFGFPGFDWDKSLTEEEANRIRQDVERFVRRRLSVGILDSLYIMDDLLVPEGNMCNLVLTHTRWQHADIMLDQQHYIDIASRLPLARSASFDVQSLDILSTPLPEPHLRLRELKIQADSFDDQALKAILTSFPNLVRLYVHQPGQDDSPLVDLVRDNGSLLLFRGGFEQDAEVAGMIRLLPDLLVFDYYNMREECFAALASHCPRLMYVRADWEGEPFFMGEDDYDELPSPAINLLLTCCPQLVRVNCPDAPLHIRHVMNGGPWVCRNLRYLRCETLGIPWIDWSYELYDTLMNRWPEIANSKEECDALSEQGREMLRTIELREQCRQVMEEQLTRVPLLRVDSRCECLMDFMHEKGYQNYIRMKRQSNTRIGDPDGDDDGDGTEALAAIVVTAPRSLGAQNEAIVSSSSFGGFGTT